MPEFTYQAQTESQETKTGQVTAANAAEAVASLESQGLAVQMIRQIVVEEDEPSEPVPLVKGNEEQILRSRVEQALERREALAPALAAFAEEMPVGRPRRELKRLAARVGAGASAAELCRTPEMSADWIPLVSSGAPLGSTSYLHDLFTEASRDNTVRTQRIRVLAYPLVVFCVALIVFVFLCVLVVPTFSDIYQSFELELPNLSRWIVGLSDEMLHHPIRFYSLLLICPAVGYGVLRLTIATGVPGFLFGSLFQGNSRRVSAMATFIRRVADSLQAGMPTHAALRLAGRASGQVWVSREADRLASAIESQESPPRLIGLPTTMLFALRAGPNNEPNVRLLQEVADLYTERVRSRFDWSSGFIPQATIVAVGLVVAVIVLALYLPLVSLINGLTG